MCSSDLGVCSNASDLLHSSRSDNMDCIGGFPWEASDTFFGVCENVLRLEDMCDMYANTSFSKTISNACLSQSFPIHNTHSPITIEDGYFNFSLLIEMQADHF